MLEKYNVSYLAKKIMISVKLCDNFRLILSLVPDRFWHFLNPKNFLPINWHKMKASKQSLLILENFQRRIFTYSKFTFYNCGSMSDGSSFWCFFLCALISAKGQTNSKWIFQPYGSSKKTNEKNFVFTTWRLVFVRFWKKVKTPKRHLEINWPL